MYLRRGPECNLFRELRRKSGSKKSVLGCLFWSDQLAAALEVIQDRLIQVKKQTVAIMYQQDSMQQIMQCLSIVDDEHRSLLPYFVAFALPELYSDTLFSFSLFS